jgi:hypothetical protein
MPEPLILDSVTHLEEADRGRAAHCASHGGSYAGIYAARMGIGAVILNDAGIGREQAGLGGVELLGDLGVPAAAISHRSARIGDGQDGYVRGILSHANAPARKLGLRAGMTCKEALARLEKASLAPAPQPPRQVEHRHEIAAANPAGIRVIVMDSISLVKPEDAGHIAVTASHGGLLAGKPETAVKHPVYAVVCNDADRGIDDAGISRLPALDARGIAGACVSAFSARIGDGQSTWDDGVVSALNETARKRGGEIGQSCKDFAAAMIEERVRELGK